MKKTIFVTGGAGYIGVHTLVCLVEAGYHVVVLDNFSNSSPLALARVEKLTGAKVRLLEGDVRNTEMLERFFVERAEAGEPVSCVLHLAYVDSHVVLVPTTASEGTSLSCIEALATNNAVISTNVGGLPNLIVDGYNGLLIRPSVWDLVQAVERLICDRSLVARLAANGQLTAKAFSKDEWDRRWREVIDTVVFAD